MWAPRAGSGAVRRQGQADGRAGIPRRLALAFNGAAEEYVPAGGGQVAPDDAHVHIAGGTLLAGERLSDVRVRVLDADGNLTRANVHIAQPAPAGEACLMYGGDELGGERSSPRRATGPRSSTCTGRRRWR